MTEQADTPIEYYYRRGAMTGAAVLAVLLLGVSLALVWFRYPYAGGMMFADYLILLSVLFFAGMLGFALRLVLKHPVAVRLDATGASGAHFPDIRWSEVAEISETGHGRYAAVGFVLKNPPAVFARWSLWEKRFRLKLPSRYHFAFLTGPIAVPRAEIVADMNRFLSTAKR